MDSFRLNVLLKNITIVRESILNPRRGTATQEWSKNEEVVWKRLGS